MKNDRTKNSGGSFRTTISIPSTIYAKAQSIMKARDFSDFSGFLQQLIREEWERRAERNHVPSAGPKQKLQPSDQ